MKVLIDSEKIIKVLEAERSFCTVINDLTKELLDQISKACDDETSDTPPDVD